MFEDFRNTENENKEMGSVVRSQQMAKTIKTPFEYLIPPLTKEEHMGLLVSMLTDGCREPLILWGNILVDGHNRLKICVENSIAFKTRQMDFLDETGAKIWMINNQFARRNLSLYQRAQLGLKKAELIRPNAKENQRLASGGDHKSEDYKKNQGLSNWINLENPTKPIEPPDPLPEVHIQKEAAKFAKVGKGTIARVQFIDKRADQKTKDDLAKGKATINQVYNKLRKQQEIQKVKEVISQESVNGSVKPTIYLESENQFINRLDDKSVDLLLTDPPSKDDINIFVKWLPPYLEKIKPTGRAYIFIEPTPQELSAYLSLQCPQHIKLEQVLVWTFSNARGGRVKKTYNPGYKAILYYAGIYAPDLDCPLANEMATVQNSLAPDDFPEQHIPWQKPMKLARRIIRHSTKEGDLVIDPFAGSGTFSLAANKLGRKSLACDTSKDKLKMAEQRGCDMQEEVDSSDSKLIQLPEVIYPA